MSNNNNGVGRPVKVRHAKGSDEWAVVGRGSPAAQRSKEQKLAAAIKAGELDALREAIDAADAAGCSVLLLRQARERRDSLRKSVRQMERRASMMKSEENARQQEDQRATEVMAREAARLAEAATNEAAREADLVIQLQQVAWDDAVNQEIATQQMARFLPEAQVWAESRHGILRAQAAWEATVRTSEAASQDLLAAQRISISAEGEAEAAQSEMAAMLAESEAKTIEVQAKQLAAAAAADALLVAQESQAGADGRVGLCQKRVSEIAAELARATAATAACASVAHEALAAANEAREALSAVAAGGAPTGGRAENDRQGRCGGREVLEVDDLGASVDEAASRPPPPSTSTAMVPDVPTATDESTCVVCWNAPRAYLLLPCSHLCLCTGCADTREWTKCPLCRAAATGTMRVFT